MVQSRGTQVLGVITPFLMLFFLGCSVDAKELEKAKNPSDLKMVIVIHRHGDRSALHTYETDPYGEKIWPEGFGQLSTKGVKQLYKQGKFLRERYENFLEPENRLKEVHIEASGYSRTLRSAAALTAGMFPPTKPQRWDDDDLGEKWNPMPIFSRDRDQDVIFSVAPCPEFDRLKANLEDLPETAILRQAYGAFGAFVKNSTKMEKFNFPASFTTIHDILYAQTQHGFALPPWATPSVFNQLTTLGDLAFQMHCGAGNTTQSRTRIRLRTGNLIRTFIEKMEEKVNASAKAADELPKMLIYSGHDTNIGLLLGALQQYGQNQPDAVVRLPSYGALLIFELFKDNTVRISLKNDKADKPQDPTVLRHPSCTTFCPLQKLKELVKPYFMEEKEFYDACKSAKATKSVDTDHPKARSSADGGAQKR